MKHKLKDMIDNLINDKDAQAQVNFHEYLLGKTREVLNIDQTDTSDGGVDTETVVDVDTDLEAE